jgi:alpha/beta hydrolase fold
MNHYLGDADINDWRASPARVTTLIGLPPAHVLTAGADPLRDEGDEYAGRLKEAGVAVTHRHFPGQFHGFFTMGKLLNQADIAASEIATWLKALNWVSLAGWVELLRNPSSSQTANPRKGPGDTRHVRSVRRKERWVSQELNPSYQIRLRHPSPKSRAKRLLVLTSGWCWSRSANVMRRSWLTSSIVIENTSPPGLR